MPISHLNINAFDLKSHQWIQQIVAVIVGVLILQLHARYVFSRLRRDRHIIGDVCIAVCIELYELNSGKKDY